MSAFGSSTHPGPRRYRWASIVSAVALAAGAAAFAGASPAAAAPAQPPAAPTAATTFTATASGIAASSNPLGVAIGDLHDTSSPAIAANTAACNPGPGIPSLPTCQNDLLLSDSGDTQLRVLLKDAGDSGFGSPQSVNFTGALPGAVAIADFNGDGINDLAVTNEGSDSVTVFFGQPGGGYTSEGIGLTFPGTVNDPTDFQGNSPFGIAVGDLGNGYPDIVVPVTGTPIGGGVSTGGEIAVLMNDGHGNFTETNIPTGNLAQGSAPGAVAIADLDNGRNDIVVADEGGDGTVFSDQGLDIFMNNGGGFTTPGGYSTEFLPMPSLPGALAIGDFNGDGRPDIVTTDDEGSSGDDITLFLNQGHGKFAQSQIAGGGFDSAVAAGDLNGDGLDDFAITNQNDGTITVFMTSLDPASTSPKGISFTQTTLSTNETAFPFSLQPSAIAIGHLNSANGANDIAVTNTFAASDSLTVFTNTTPQAPPAVRDSGSSLGNPAKVSGLAVKAGDLAVSYVSADGPKTGGQTAFVSGGGLDWALASRENSEPGDSEVWSARVPPGTPAHITVTATAGVTKYKVALTAVSYSHAYGIAATAAVGGSHAPSATLTTTQGNSWVWAVGTDWLSATARKVGSGQTLVQQDLAASDETYWVQDQTVPTAAAGTSVKMNDTAPSTNPYNLVAVEIVP